MSGSEKDEKPIKVFTPLSLAEAVQNLKERVEELEKAPQLKATATCNSCHREEKQIVAIKCAHTGMYLELACGHYLYYIQATLPTTKVAYERAK